MTTSFKKAERKRVYIKLAITGPSGSGKTYSALRLATGLAEGGKIAVIDTENGSASLYSDRFDFDVLDIQRPYDDNKFVAGIKAAVDGGYKAVVIDSASHFWEGILEYKGKLDSRPGSNSYTNWNQAGAKFNDIIKAVLGSQIHLICCLRSKMDYVLEENTKGKMAPRKVGLAPIMRDGIEYEFTTIFDVAMNHEAEVSKDRTGLFTDTIFQITEDTGKQILGWLDGGKTMVSSPVEKAAPAAAPTKSPSPSSPKPPPEHDPMDDEQIDGDHPRDRLSVKLNPHNHEVNKFLISKGLIKDGEDWRDAELKTLQKIESDVPGFLKAAGAMK